MKVNQSRRNFISYSCVSGALLVASPISFATGKSSSKKEVASLTPLVKIHRDNRITFYYPSPEMGQGVDTSLAMLFMEELGANMELVTVEPLPYGLKRDAEGKIAWKSVPQGAGGSTSISRNWPLLRNAGATTRQLILQAAAKFCGQPVSKLTIQQSMVLAPDGKPISIGKLTELAAMEALPEDFTPELKSRDNWQTIGKATHSKQAEAIVTGEPLYAMDMDYPQAKIAVMLRSPYFDGEVVSVDDTAAKALAGVHDVVILPRPDINKFYTYLAAGVAVIADDFWTAKKARDLLVIKWKNSSQQESSASLDEQCRELLTTRGQIVRSDGDYAQSVKQAQRVFSRSYTLPTVSHAQLEPQNCIAHVTEDNCTIIGPMQSPSGASRFAKAITGFDRVKMDIRYTRLGGGFGRRLTSDHVAEAVTISKLVKRPIKLIWTREDDMCHDFYRPMGHHQLSAAIDNKGKVIGWSHRLAGRPKYYRRDGQKPEELYGADLYIDDFPSALVENLEYEYLVAKSAIPQGSWRAPAHTANAFTVQSFVNELAKEIGQDPLQLRLTMLGEARELPYGQHGGPVFDTGRMANVLRQVAKMANWPGKMPKGRALGTAGHFTFGGYCAQVAQVKLNPDNSFRVEKVWASIDVGTVINPEGVTAQVEGGINDGLSTALGQQVIFNNNQVTSKNFDTYPMMRMADSVPEIDVHIVSSEKDPSGVGEMGLPPLAPAVAHAVMNAGGPVLRSQPFISS